MNYSKVILFVVAIFLSQYANAQRYMVIGQKGGVTTQYPMEIVDSVYFVGYDINENEVSSTLTNYCPSYCSTWTPSSLTRSFGDVKQEDNYIYATGQFGLRKFDYTNPYAPSMLNSYYYNDISVTGRSLALNGDFVYSCYRSTQPMDRESVAPELREDFESIATIFNGNENSSISFSNNRELNAFFKSLRVLSFDGNTIDRIYIYKARDMGGYFRNNLLIQKIGGSSLSFGTGNYNTKEEALAALQEEYIDNKGNSCKVDWNAVSVGGKVYNDVKLNMSSLFSFDNIEQHGATIVSSIEDGAPNRWIHSALFITTQLNSQNQITLYKNIENNTNEYYQTFWLKVEESFTDVIEMPVLSSEGGAVLSVVLSGSGSDTYTLGVNVGTNISNTGTQLKIGEWYNLKTIYTPQTASLLYRDKECDQWKPVISTSSIPNNVTSIAMGIKTSIANAKVYVDDYYYNPTDIDLVSYIIGRLDINRKDDLSLVVSLPLDFKANNLFVLKDKLVVNFLCGFNVYDIAIPSSPKLIYYHRPDTYKEYQGGCVFSHDGRDYAILCNYHKGITIVDITEKENCHIVKEMPVQDSLLVNGSWLVQYWDAAIDYPYVYVAAAPNSVFVGTPNDRRGIMVFNIADTENITSEFFPIPQSDYWTVMTNGDRQPTKIFKHKDYLFLDNEELGVAVFKIVSDGHLEFVETITLPSGSFAGAIYVSDDDYLIVGDGGSGSTLYPNKNMYIYKLKE